MFKKLLRETVCSLKRAYWLSALLFIPLSATTQPKINSITPGNAAIGATIIIHGSGFHLTPSNNVVYIGAVQATVTTATANSLSVKVPVGASHRPLSVTTDGYTAYSTAPYNVIAGTTLTSTSFSERTSFTVGDQPSSILSCDFNSDGKPELVTGNFTGGVVSILTNKSVPGVVAFEPAIQLIIKTIQEGIATGDVNSDGRPDLVVASLNEQILSVFINTSSGNTVSFASRIDIPVGVAATGVRSIGLSDIDGDGRTDLIVADNNKIYNWPTNTSNGLISVYRNIGTTNLVSFAPPVSFQGMDYLRKLALGDLNGDKKVDIVVASQVSHGINIFQNNSTPGNIQFGTAQSIATGTHAEQVAMGDLDGDGRLDLAVTHLSSGNIALLRNTSSGGNITFASQVNLVGVSSIGISIADMNGDSKPDLAVAHFLSNRISVWPNTSSGNTLSFTSNLQYATGGSPVEVVIGDIDGDHFPDLSLAAVTTNKAEVLRMPGLPPAFTIDLGKDTILCQGDSLLLEPYTSTATFKWSNGTSTPSIWVKKAGRYWVEVNNGMTTASDTITIQFSTPPVVNLGNDRMVCTTEKVVLKASVSNASYLWSNGTLLDSLVVTQPGTYWLQVKQDGACIVRDTIAIAHKPLPAISLGKDTALCSGASIWLEAQGIDIANYTWKDGSNQSRLLVTQPGSYWVEATGTNGCKNADTLQINAQMLPTIHWGTDTVLCKTALILAPQVTDGTVLWWNGATSPTITVSAPGRYSLIATNTCGSVSDAITVSKGICELYMPSAFTPNGDGINDVFRIKYTSFIKTFHLTIFNRWGQQLYTSTKPTEGWSGTYLKTGQPAGTYVWTIQLIDESGLQKQYKGTVVLIR